MRSIVTILAAAAGAALPTLACTTPAVAAPAYYTAFYRTADYTGTPRVVDHLVCDGAVTLLAGRFAATESRPLPGCVVQVYTNASPLWATLCIGRAELPLLSRYNPEVRLVPGHATLCPAEPSL